MNFNIRKPNRIDADLLLDLADATGIFEENEVKELLGSTLEQLFTAQLAADHLVWLIEDLEQQKIVGWSYFAESGTAPGVWDVLWIGAHPKAHGTGASKFLLNEIEAEVGRRKGRLIIIETSSDPRLARARAFYPKLGYEERGSIPDFYARGISKIIFSKTIAQ